jgi:hypothetical protein
VALLPANRLIRDHLCLISHADHDWPVESHISSTENQQTARTDYFRMSRDPPEALVGGPRSAVKRRVIGRTNFDINSDAIQ